VTAVTDPSSGSGDTTGFAYTATDCGQDSSKNIVGKTVVTDPNSHPTSYCYDKDLEVKHVADALGHTKNKNYDPNSNVTSVTDPGGDVSKANYSSDNKLTSTAMPTGASSTFSYGDSSNPYQSTMVTNPQGNTTSYNYGASGSVKAIGKNLQDTTQPHDLDLDYNNHDNNYGGTGNAQLDGTLRTSKDAKGTTTFDYDGSGNLTKITPPGNSQQKPQSFGYDHLSRITSITDAKGQTKRFTYDALGRISRVDLPDGTAVSYDYDADGNRTARHDNGTDTTYSYDAHNRRTTEIHPDPATGVSGRVDYSYDAEGNLLSLTDAGGKVSYAYNEVNWLTSLTEPKPPTALPGDAAPQTTYQYDAKGNQTQVAYPNGVTQKSAYDASKRVTHIWANGPGGSTITDYTYTYCKDGSFSCDKTQDGSERQAVRDKDGNTTAYNYSDHDRLHEAKTTNAGNTTNDYLYEYDGAGNRTKQNHNGQDTTYTYDDANELTQAGNTTYQYDANGNLAGDSTGRTLSYNPRDQTTAFALPGQNPLPASYAGTTQAERTNLGDLQYLNNAAGVGLQVNKPAGIGSAATTTYYTHDNAGHLVGERTSTAGNYYYLFDALGSVVAATDKTGAVAATYRYDPYGADIGTTGTLENPWRYASGYYDQQTKLYHYGARYYDPALGRFNQTDPIQHQADPKQSNKYVYASADPVNLTDLTGKDVFGDVGNGLASAVKYGFQGFASGFVDGFGLGCASALELGPVGCVGVGLVSGAAGGIIVGVPSAVGGFIYGASGGQ